MTSTAPTAPTVAPTEAKATAQVKAAEDEPISFLGDYGSTIAMLDLHGQTAPEPDWFRFHRFVCSYCMQEADGIPIPLPVGFRKSTANSGLRLMNVSGPAYGSLGCAFRFSIEHRHTFMHELGGYLALMARRVYGFRKELPLLFNALAKADLPPFLPDRCHEPFDGIAYHQQLNAGLDLHLPDPKKWRIRSEHSALLIDAFGPLPALGLSRRTLQRMFNGFVIGAKTTATATAAAATAKETKEEKKDQQQEKKTVQNPPYGDLRSLFKPFLPKPSGGR